MTDTLRDDALPETSKHADERAAAVGRDGTVFGRTVTIARPPAELYAFWRDLTNLPQIMDNVVAIEPIDDRRSRWTVRAPGGGTVEWTARITEDRPDTLIAWEAEDDADVPNAGQVTFRDAGARGTVVTATISYDPPAGIIGKVVAKLFQREPAIQARRDLRRFKQLMETGEIATNAMTRARREEEDA